MPSPTFSTIFSPLLLHSQHLSQVFTQSLTQSIIPTLTQSHVWSLMWSCDVVDLKRKAAEAETRERQQADSLSPVSLQGVCISTLSNLHRQDDSVLSLLFCKHSCSVETVLTILSSQTCLGSFKSTLEMHLFITAHV